MPIVPIGITTALPLLDLGNDDSTFASTDVEVEIEVFCFKTADLNLNGLDADWDLVFCISFNAI